MGSRSPRSSWGEGGHRTGAIGQGNNGNGFGPCGIKQPGTFLGIIGHKKLIQNPVLLSIKVVFVRCER